jgi:hypothetical protein
MQNPDYNPYVQFKSSLLDDWCIFIKFHFLKNVFFLVKLALLIHK